MLQKEGRNSMLGATNLACVVCTYKENSSLFVLWLFFVYFTSNIPSSPTNRGYERVYAPLRTTAIEIGH